MCHFIWNITNRFYSIRFVAKLRLELILLYIFVCSIEEFHSTVGVFCADDGQCSFIDSIPCVATIYSCAVESVHASFNMLTYSFAIDREPINCTLEPHISFSFCCWFSVCRSAESNVALPSRRIIWREVENNMNKNVKLILRRIYKRCFIATNMDAKSISVSFPTILVTVQKILLLVNFYDFSHAINLIIFKRMAKDVTQRQNKLLTRPKKVFSALWKKVPTNLPWNGSKDKIDYNSTADSFILFVFFFNILTFFRLLLSLEEVSRESKKKETQNAFRDTWRCTWAQLPNKYRLTEGLNKQALFVVCWLWITRSIKTRNLVILNVPSVNI